MPVVNGRKVSAERIVHMTCERCNSQYATFLYLGEPYAKRFCSRKCVSSSLGKKMRHEGEMSKQSKEVIFYADPYCEEKAFKRFVDAYEENVSHEDLMARFGDFYNSFKKKLTKESRLLRKEAARDVYKQLTGMHTHTVSPHASYSVVKKRYAMFRKMKEYFKSVYTPARDGLTGYSGSGWQMA